MATIEFNAELTGDSVLALPPEVVARLPKSGSARVVVLTDEDADGWQVAAYEHFLRDDAAEDAVYDNLR